MAWKDLPACLVQLVGPSADAEDRLESELTNKEHLTGSTNTEHGLGRIAIIPYSAGLFAQHELTNNDGNDPVSTSLQVS